MFTIGPVKPISVNQIFDWNPVQAVNNITSLTSVLFVGECNAYIVAFLYIYISTKSLLSMLRP